MNDQKLVMMMMIGNEMNNEPKGLPLMQMREARISGVVTPTSPKTLTQEKENSIPKSVVIIFTAYTAR